MSPPKVFIADSISQRGIDELTRDGALEVKRANGIERNGFSRRHSGLRGADRYAARQK